MEKQQNFKYIIISRLKSIRYYFEYLFAVAILKLLNCFTLEQASDFGASLFEKIGMKLAVSNRARNNLSKIFSVQTASEREEIVRQVWQNLGRMLAESPAFLKMNETELEKHFNLINIENLLKYKNKKALFFTAHMGNWEIARKMVEFKGIKLHAVYRKMNNPRIESLVSELRGSLDIPMIPKGKAGAKILIDKIKNQKQIVMLLDQKMNDGIAVDFMGHPAMTAPAIATLALKYDCPIIPIQIVRKDKYYFDMIFHPELDLNNKDEATIMQEINDIIGSWVKQNPGQWFWLHKRWIE
jgi:Kdo2-lipid IVA lauroyltransferase/acyltransferase